MKKIAILGAGESGVGAALLAHRQGAEVWVSDAGEIAPRYRQTLEEKGIPFETGRHTIDKFFEADVIVKSPGIPPTAEVIQRLKGAGKYIISEVEYAFQCTSAHIVAITGSNGKTTTTALTYELLKAAGLKVEVGGNIGHSFARLVAEKPADYYVVELSSFQLDDIDRFRPAIAVLLNITADHLDRYGYDMARYAAAKLAIARNQQADDLFIYRQDDPWTIRAMSGKPLQARTQCFALQQAEGLAAYLSGQHIQLPGYGSFSTAEMQLMGPHNALNAMAALLVAKALGAQPEQIRPALNGFTAIEHRLEKVAQIAGVTYINDSKATNVESVWYALQSMDRPVVWIVGGIDKGNDYSLLEELVKKKVKYLIVLGENKEKFFQHFGYKPFAQVMRMKDAVELAARVSEAGDYVLLSPACSSFDLFENYAQRGKVFKYEVKQLGKPAQAESP
ncbi:MAG: UDP-N-acetylmuramoyl-L-alanine--D-glutamate ligase [Bacteroidetes bacterium]|nr:MAG: UDP-N-acetylmuramoyl-L-alanine--D-glutamate ligase [Bacteroidota bacterium]